MSTGYLKIGMWVGIGAIGGVVAGWLLAVVLTCGPRCAFDVALFDAIGTWVSGVLIAGVGAAYALYRTRREREDAHSRELAEAFALARACAIRFRPLGDEEHGFTRVAIQFENKLDERVHDVELRYAEGTAIRRDVQVAAGRGWGAKVMLESLGIAEKYPTARDASLALKRHGQAKVTFGYTIRGFRFERVGSDVSLVGSSSSGPRLRTKDVRSRPRASAGRATS